MKKISFTKMSGAGNDFIILDKDMNISFDLNDEIIRRLCERRNGIGADGVITLFGSRKYSFEMEYFNADGSSHTLCGNGARCAIKYAELTGRLNNAGNFTSGGIEYSGEILDDKKVKFNLNPPSKMKYNFMVKAGGQLIKAHYLHTGSPHIIIDVNEILKEPGKNNTSKYNLENLPVVETGREIRYLPEFAPEGVNVNFIEVKEGKVYIRTYERGVENETLACGTGSAAAAVAVNKIFGIHPPVTLHTKGGEELIVDYIPGDPGISGLSLTGPARVTYKGSFLYKDFF